MHIILEYISKHSRVNISIFFWRMLKYVGNKTQQRKKMVNLKNHPTSGSAGTALVRITMWISRWTVAFSNSIFRSAFGIRTTLFELAPVNLGWRTSTSCLGIAFASGITFTLMSSNEINASVDVKRKSLKSTNLALNLSYWMEKNDTFSGIVSTKWVEKLSKCNLEFSVSDPMCRAQERLDIDLAQLSWSTNSSYTCY